MLLLYQVAIALFVGFGPLFILCLLFDQTKQLFQKWLLYGIGTMFSMGVLAAMVSICMKMVVKLPDHSGRSRGLAFCCKRISRTASQARRCRRAAWAYC
ncbi:type IV secretion system protein [Xanthomonas campestris pv. raphani]|nr:type IV secretion system protein [Xanthomonas campestris]MEA9656625.1 type IV secretion system protein [Xanthomonas campestris pv. raphani]MEA9755505.1 type IV secretion system protein [Xanthomonas campestris pv. raphani]MEA9761989.1 type IV secretion system protein [Xanthomonas campestris pv. raphani]MEA9814593.1 type IV secretion system protein [Xanthomonas campestris pv. raphani]MEA9907726.1 type IV secretion system protein [Xanthomonas campestris pv. raphani]